MCTYVASLAGVECARQARGRRRRGARTVGLRARARSIYPEGARRHSDDEFGEGVYGHLAPLTEPFVDESDGTHHAKLVGALFCGGIESVEVNASPRPIEEIEW